MHKKVYQFLLNSKGSGGAIYEHYVTEVLKKSLYEVEEITLIEMQKVSKIEKLLTLFQKLKVFNTQTQNRNSIVIRNLATLLFLKNTHKEVVVFHHYDPQSYPFFIKWFQKMVYFNFKRNKNKIDKIVVVSQYWKTFLEHEGFNGQQITTVYNAFDMDLYTQKEEQIISAFKKKYDLASKPIVYIGNPQAIKGAPKVYALLKELDVHLVTSGKKHIELSCINLELSFEEYLLLLQSSTLVVLMSQFKEGWNRVAHEAMLCKTAVIGSGKGGMAELLTEGKQLICEERELLKNVETLLSNPLQLQKMTEDGYHYAKQFTLEQFQEGWEKCLKSL
jgi:glycosyltransferase involved in cell wall biosynthesis